MSELEGADFCCEAGDVFLSERKYDEAEDSYAEALMLDPAHPYAAGGVLLSYICSIEGHAELASSALAFIRSVDPQQHQNPYFLHHWGAILMRCELYSKACEVFTKCEAHKDYDHLPTVLGMHAGSLLEKGAFQEAEERFKALAETSSEAEHIYYKLIQGFIERHSFQDNEAYMRERLWRDRKDPLPKDFSLFEQYRCLSRFYSIWAKEIAPIDPDAAEEKLSEALVVAKYAHDLIGVQTDKENIGELDRANLLVWDVEEMNSQFNQSRLEPPEDYSLG